MKTLYIFTILLFLLYIAGSCNDDQQKLFSGRTTMHFALSDNELDSIACSFLNTSESYITVNLPVELNGYAGQNYRFRLKADSSQTTAIVNKHYQPLEEFYEIKKDEYSLNVPITLNYSPELDTLSVKLVLQLEPAAYMSTGISYRQEATIVSSNRLPPIPYWDGHYSSYFGPYSRVKHRYILSELKVFDKDGNIVDEWTSTNEAHKIKNLVEGETYTLHEEYAPEGYVIATDLEFTVSKDKETQKIEMIDKIVEMSKKDIAGNELEGATIIVTNTKTKNIIDKWVSGKEPHRIQGLIEGETYVMHEEIAIDGYVKATDIEFTVSKDKETQKIEMIDKVVLVSKTDLVTGEELPGAELEVTDKEGNVIDKWTSTNEPHHVTGLEEGKEYTLTEKTCPYGYEVAESINFVVTTDKETQLVEMKDMPILKTIKVIKADSETKETIKAKFKFGIYEDPECTKLIKEVKADKESGTVTFEDLRYGTYYIKETKAPFGYQLSDKVVKIEINNEGTFADGELLEDNDSICTFTYYNKLIPKIQTGSEMNYILLIGSAIISLLGITTGIVVLKRKNKNN